ENVVEDRDTVAIPVARRADRGKEGLDVDRIVGSFVDHQPHPWTKLSDDGAEERDVGQVRDGDDDAEVGWESGLVDRVQQLLAVRGGCHGRLAVKLEECKLRVRSRDRRQLLEKVCQRRRVWRTEVVRDAEL